MRLNFLIFSSRSVRSSVHLLSVLSLYCARLSISTSYSLIYGLALLHIIPLVVRANVIYQHIHASSERSAPMASVLAPSRDNQSGH
ncbi:hypothetical protein B0H21DRAFT_759449 [Amylocystis lapponica]|nr:hypothetical protein B0H21DRAFT_759449 [Amylocystis lapponica]